MVPAGYHEKRIVHRDLKPANVKIRPDGNVKVLDFGLAKVRDAEAVGVDQSDSPRFVFNGRPRRISVFNDSGQQMTIKNLSGSSMFYQIMTLTGGDVVLRTGKSFATFIWDASTYGQWILESTN
jgi:serine/threonine protein kinase